MGLPVESQYIQIPVPPRPLGPDSNFDHTVEAVAENPVSFEDLIEREGMREQGAKVHAAVPHQFHQPAHP